MSLNYFYTTIDINSSLKTPYISQDNIYLHVYNRGVNGCKVFFEQENYRYLLSKVEKSINKDSISVLAYCLMPNHFHLLVFQRKAYAISKFISSTYNPYTKAINNWKNRKGHLFQDKYKVHQVDNEKYLVDISRYIRLNPVRAKLVKKP